MGQPRVISLALTGLAAAVIGGLSAAPAGARTPAPPCPAGTEPAAVFDGLPNRIAYGPPRVFEVSETFEDWALDGTIQVTMADAATGKPFFSADDVDSYEELYVQLDLNDKPVTITASYDQYDSTNIVNPLTCRTTITRTVRGYRHVLLPRQCENGSYRPRTVIVACGDGNFQLRSLRWRHWNRSAATGKGRALANDCIPFCFNGTFHRYKVRVRAYRIRRCRFDDDRYRYTRLRIVYPGARPAGAPRRELARIPCVSA